MRYDAIVIGSGQCGGPLSHRLADAGWKVALVEEKHLGGTCINTGCTPTKTMVASAQVAHYARNANRWGVCAADVSVDLAAVVARKDEVVKSFRAGQQRNVDKRPGIHLYRTRGRFTGPHSVQVGDEVIESEKIFINTGAHPSVPPIEGLNTVDFLTNVTVMELNEVPEHLIVLGGGYVGLEFGQIYRRFGSEVTVIHQGGQLLPREDPEMAAELQKALEAEGMKFLLNAKTTKVESAVVLTVDGKKIAGSHLLVATGRTPNSGDLGLDKAGVKVDARGFIPVNGKLETNVPGIWATGDVNGGPAFTHISYNDFQIVYGNLMEGKTLSTDGRIVPYTVFTDPQLGCVGFTEKEAREKGYQLKIGKMPVANVARTIERGETAGLMKLIVDAATDQILGASILSPEGGELVQILHTMMLGKQPYTLLKGAIYIHPTLAEGFYGLMEDVKPA